MGSRKGYTARFAVGTADGPRSSTWRVWIGGDDSVYVGPRNLAQGFHASLHPHRWHIAFSPEAATRLVGDASKRFVSYPRPVDVLPGIARAFTILVPSTEVVLPAHRGVEKAPVTWRPKPPPCVCTVFSIVFTPGSSADERVREHVVASWTLGHGWTLWILAGERVELPEERAVWEHARGMALRELDAHPETYEGEPGDLRAAVIVSLRDGTKAFLDLLVDQAFALG